MISTLSQSNYTAPTPTPTNSYVTRNTDGEIRVKVEDYSNTRIKTYPRQEPQTPGQNYRPANKIEIHTESENDVINLSMKDGRVLATINGVSVFLDSDGSSGSAKIHISTNEGNDKITIAPQVKATLTINTGDGKDTVITGGGSAQVYLGDGDDTAVLGAGGGELYGQDGDDKLYGGPAGSAHLSGGSGRNIMMSNLQRSDDQATWILAQGENDKIRARSFTTMRIESQSAYVVVHPEVQAQIHIAENAGNTETVALWAGREEENISVTYTGRNEVEKDNQRTQQAPRTESEENALWP